MKNPGLLLMIASLLLLGVLPAAPAARALAAEDSILGAPGGDADSDGAKAPPKKKSAEEDVTGGRFAGDPIYVHVSPMVLPVISDNGVEQLVTIVLDVQVKDFDAADQMHANMPKVMDSLMRALYGGLGQGVLRNGKLVNVGKVKNKAIAAVGEVIGNDNVRDVLVQSVSQRML